MQIEIHFYSYFRQLTGCDALTEDVPEAETLGALCQKLFVRFPRLAAFEKSMLMAVGVDYQTAQYRLRDRDEVSLFPPVQGG